MQVMAPLPSTLQTAQQMMMKVPIPAFLLWGDELRFFYNSVFNENLDVRRKNSFPTGLPIGDVYPECLPLLLPVVKGVRNGGAGVRSGQAFFPLARTWNSEPTTWTYCFEGVTDELGRVEGIFVSCLQQALPVVMARKIERELELTRDEMEGQRRIYEAIADSTPDLIYVFDLNYKFIFANKALLAMWGRSWEESRGRGLLELGYEPWHAEMHEREIDRVVATKKAIRGEVSFPHAELGRRIYDYIFAPVLDERGEVSAIAGTTRDISELKAAEEVLRRSEEQLEQVVSERTKELQRSNDDLLQFAHVASHDLKEPTRKVRFFADRLLRDPESKLSETGRHFVEKIVSASDRMFMMIEGVLNYSKVTNLKEDYAAVDLAEVIGQIVTDLEVVIQQKEARIETHDLPVVHGAPMLLYQLFYNLINNSLKFARKGVPARVVITAYTRNGGPGGRPWVEIEVRDNGIGFPQAYAKNIFSTFTRLHPKDQYEGTGLGLSLCKKIVERHGGTIEASSHPGEGSVFRIFIPFAGS
ncbi:MAG TPA: ATP-binding protein [Puia sp.]|uniref:sensor histidine kinase n=1 Tax=Puia sp. TaxID=2045100 RepID=UPI002C8136F0|nr:ATP-binding protein [Puia sp.]HVU94044.1 ATP-binding protein [Puia sp.]